MPVPMVGRAEELAELHAAWSRVLGEGSVSLRSEGSVSVPEGAPAGPATATAAPRTAIISGEAGSGKSRLVTALLESLDPAPRIVLSGRARVHTPAPYDWLAAALTAHELTARQLETAPPVEEDALAWLAQRPGTPARRYAPGALLRLAVRTVRALAGDGPAVIVAEDLHALDPASLNLIGELATTPGLPALLVVTSRPPDEAISPQLAARTLARLAGAPGAIRAHLGPLRQTEVALLLERVYQVPVAPDVAAAVWQRTGGNPYWLIELLAADRGTGPESLAYDPLPDHVRRLVAGRLAEGNAGEAALHAASDHLAAGLPEAALRAVEVGLRGGRDPLPLLRIAAAAATAATHFADAIGYAARWQALASVDDLIDRAAAHRTFATACGRLGRARECAAQLAVARELLTEAGASASEPGAVERRPDASAGGAEWARYLAAFAESRLDAGGPDEAADAARRALRLVSGDRDPATEGAATVTLAAALDALGERETAMAMLRAARRAAATRRDLDTLGRAVTCLITAHLPRLDEPAAWHMFDEAIATTTRFGLEHDAGRTILAGVRLAIRVGNAARARELVSARLPVETDLARCTVLAAVAGRLALEGDDRTAAEKFAVRADADAVAADDPAALAAAAQLRVALGEPITHYADRVPAAHDRRHPAQLAEVARLALATGTPPESIRAVIRDRVGDSVGGLGSRAGHQLDCALLASEGATAAAVESANAGLTGPTAAAWLDADTHLIAASSLIKLGRTAEAREHGRQAAELLARWPGRRQSAVAALLASLDTPTATTGPVDPADPAEMAEMAEAAETVRDSLTAREIEVLACIADGMSNKQVARSLGISVRTVTVHVSNLLRKTRSASRTEAAVWALRHRLAGRSANRSAVLEPVVQESAR